MLTLASMLNKYTKPPYNRTPDEVEQHFKEWKQLGQKAAKIKKRKNKWEREKAKNKSVP
jgi:hypothetical protein